MNVLAPVVSLRVTKYEMFLLQRVVLSPFLQVKWLRQVRYSINVKICKGRTTRDAKILLTESVVLRMSIILPKHSYDGVVMREDDSSTK